MRDTIFKIIEQNLSEYGINVGYLVAGIFSVLATIKKMIQEKNVASKIGFVFTGLGCANYITPVAVDLMNWVHIDVTNSYGVAWLVGYLGKQSAELIYGIFKNKYTKNETTTDNPEVN